MGLKRILMPLDAHLDTRLGTIARLSQEAATKLLESDDYWSRENDFWEIMTDGLVTREQFNQAYAERGGDNTNETLQHSIRTNITPFVMRLLTDDQLIRLNQMEGTGEPIGLTINYWPYDLTSDGIEAVRDIIETIYSTEVELVSIPMSELTPGLLNDNFAACVMYEFPEWCKLHAIELGEARMNCFNFISPKIFEADVSNMTPDAKQYILTAFRVTKLIHMDFEWIDASYFSVFNVHGKERPKFPTMKDHGNAE